jgi:hypothetical protein
LACLLERNDLGMPCTIVCVVTLTNGRAVLNDNRADHNAGTGKTHAFFGEVESPAHVGEIIHVSSGE